MTAPDISPMTRTSGAALRDPSGRGLQLLVLTAVMAAAGYVRTAMSPLQEAIRIALSLSDNQMALVQGSIIGIPVAITAIPLGIIIDRYSRVRLLIALVALSLLGSLATAFASGLVPLLLARCIAGVTSLAVYPVVLSIIADLYAPAQRGRVTSLAIIGQVAGNSAAFALGGQMLAVTGSEPDGWRSAMLWMTTPLAPLWFFVMMLREPPRSRRACVNPTAGQVWFALRRYRRNLGPLVIGIVAMEAAVGAILIWAAPMLSRNYGLPPDKIGAIMATGSLVSGILGPLVGGALADHCQLTGGPGRTTNLLCGLALMSAPAGMFAFVSDIAVASTLIVATMTIMLSIVVMGLTLFCIVIPTDMRGIFMSMLVATELLCALAIGPPIVSALSNGIGGPAMIGKALSVLCMAASVIAVAAFAVRSTSPLPEAA